MRAGKLDRKLTIQRFETLQNEDSGEETQVWADLYPNLWASKRTKTGREAIRSEQVVASETVVFTIRYKEVTAKDRVLFEGNIYNIISPPNEIGRKQGLELICEAKDNE